MDNPLLFLATALAVLAAPGPTNALLALAGATQGLAKSVALASAEAAGYLIAVSALGLVLGPAIAASPLAARALHLLVGAYLFFLAFRLWKQGSVAPGGAVPAVTARDVFVATLLNPKAIVFATLLPFGRSDFVIDLAAFVALVGLTAMGWMFLGAAMSRATGSSGRSRLILRFGSAVVAMFGGLVVYPAL